MEVLSLLHYISFVQSGLFSGGVLNMGEEYQDTCGTSGNCMAMLSIYVGALMVAKPMPKFLKDIILP